MAAAHQVAASDAAARAELARMATENCERELAELERNEAEPRRAQLVRDVGDGALVALDANTAAKLSAETPATRGRGGRRAGSPSRASGAHGRPQRRPEPVPRTFGTDAAQRKQRSSAFDTTAWLVKRKEKAAKTRSTPKWR